MNEILAGDIILRVITRANLPELATLYTSHSFRQSSFLYGKLFNLAYTARLFETCILEPPLADSNRFYMLEEKDTGIVLGVLGFTGIDWLQQRAELVLLMDEAGRKLKKSAAPLKVLLKLAVQEWNLKGFTIRIYADDTVTLTVLKSFGFHVAGKIENWVCVDGEERDVSLLSLLAREFHFVDG